ncbi:MAG: Asp-tRNA(Asn)/Glu-tRNA(Gln) amidotransferase subunit GatA [Desulfurococcales archaeon]|jgi:aspartyl-tRNA(Asn)/glutamyl-tRNA(Gln) amidotransferase subunit A|nr:Asp-tRNA(Asn)/Glu-tRNA(Gln) amidotransferase subunit GatA [Desulfurococcales archaeon]
MSLIGRPIHEIVDILRGDAEGISEYIYKLYERVARLDGVLRAFITLRSVEDVVKEAVESNRLGKPLAGIPIAVKDNISTMGIRTTCASKILENYVPPYDATVIERLKRSGAVVMGKTNMDEFAMGSTTENSSYGPSRNPWDPSRVPGGSSGGSAVAVSASMAPASLGSDTGGSVRNPAAFTATFGYKPTYGVLSRYGLIAYASSLDQVGLITRDSVDAALILEHIAGEDPMDPTSIDLKLAGLYERLRNMGERVDLPRARLVLIKEMWDGVDRDISREAMRAIDKLVASGFDLEEVSLPEISYALPAYYVIAFAEASSNLARYGIPIYGLNIDPEGLSWAEYYSAIRSKGFGREVKRRIMLGSYILSAGYYEEYYIKALRVRRLLRDKLLPILRRGYIASPTMPVKPPRIGEAIEDPIKLYMMDIETVIPNLIGSPAVSLVAGFTDSLPVGLQLVGPPTGDQGLLEVARASELIIGYRSLTPGI